MTSKAWLERHQIGVYAVMLLIGAGLGLVRPELSSVFEQLIYPVLGVLLYVTFLQVPFVQLRRAFTHGRFMVAALSMNFLVVPVVVWGLTRVLPQEPAILLGVFMVLLTPCIDYVIVFTDLGGGDAKQITAATPVLMLAQLLLLPVYLWLFIGERVIDVISAGPFLEAFFLLIALPLGLAWTTEVWADRRSSGARWENAMEWLPVPMLGLTLLIVVASQIPRVEGSFEQIVVVVPVYVGFLIVMPLLGRLAAGIFSLDLGPSRALVFTSVTRNSLVILPLALALPAGWELTPAVVVTQTLVELIGMVVYTRLVPTWLLPEAPASIFTGA